MKKIMMLLLGVTSFKVMAFIQPIDYLCTSYNWYSFSVTYTVSISEYPSQSKIFGYKDEYYCILSDGTYYPLDRLQSFSFEELNNMAQKISNQPPSSEQIKRAKDNIMNEILTKERMTWSMHAIT